MHPPGPGASVRALRYGGSTTTTGPWSSVAHTMLGAFALPEAYSVPTAYGMLIP